MGVEFKEFPKMARLSRDIIITEKIDGTNASIFIQAEILETGKDKVIAEVEGFTIRAGSRTKWIIPTDDNMGFAKWVVQNANELVKLGEGHHFGEWWGSGIQRSYGLKEKRFSLFNVKRWDGEDRPKCCFVVPTLYEGPFITTTIDHHLAKLAHEGSKAAPGFMKPEGIVVYHIAGGVGFKKTIEKDETPKSQQ
jgi:hypothetical protein